MDTVTVLSMSAISCLLLLVLLLQVRKLSNFTAKAIDLSLVLTRIDWLQTLARASRIAPPGKMQPGAARSRWPNRRVFVVRL